MSYLEVFGMLTGVGVEVSKFCEVGAGVSKPEAGADLESKKGDTAHLWLPLGRGGQVSARSVRTQVFSSPTPVLI